MYVGPGALIGEDGVDRGFEWRAGWLESPGAILGAAGDCFVVEILGALLRPAGDGVVVESMGAIACFSSDCPDRLVMRLIICKR